MRILLTGHNGYIGSVMLPLLKQAGYDVTNLDAGYYDACRFLPDEPAEKFTRRDLRDVTEADLKGFDAVVHLAALSNDPIGNLRADWTRDINYEGTIKLAEAAKKAGVKRFLFSSSCIMYGAAATVEVNEDSPLAPSTEYARSKVQAEEILRGMASDGFSPIYIRNGTVYGVSPRMRFDTVLNNFVGQAVATGKIVVFSDGEPWRPVMHVKDVSRTFIEYLNAPRETVHNQAFNNGAAHLNYRIRDLAKIAQDTVYGATLEVRGEASADQRSYKASFAKFRRIFPHFRFEFDAVAGAKELYEALTRLKVTDEVFQSAEFTRLKWLKRLLDSGQLDEQSLRWTKKASQAA